MELIRKLNYLVGKKFRKEIILACLVVITAAAIELLAISVFMPILDLALGAKEGNELFTYRMISYITGFTDFDHVFISLLVFTILVYIVKNAYLSWKEGYIASFSMKVRQYLSIRVMEVYLGEPYTFFLDRNTAEIIRRINGDSASIHEVVWNLITIVSLAVTSVSILVYLAVTNITLSLVLAASVGLCAVTILLSVRKRTRRYGSENLELNGKLIQYVKQAFEGIKEIKILNTEPFFLNEYKRTFQRQADITMRYKLVNALP
ncbi:MAG: hypothetical protein K6G83_14910, partial [Lachnospiraceae bacterium]|nr:hypothetical protein [Lachnospiraceae bacterium]